MSLPIFLQDKKFLQLIDKLRIKLEFIKITVLNWNELPLEEVQGKVINGNINIDGSSSLRRTASLSIFAEEKENNLANIDQLFSINKKCTLLVGIVNTVPITIIEGKNTKTNEFFTYELNYQLKYGEIIWFPLGVYVMFNPSISHSASGVTISMQLKDKMCLLNGDLGGQIHSSVDFAYQDLIVDINNNSIEKKPVLIYDIITLLVNHWGNLSLSKIIISEVPLKIKQVVKWTGLNPIYLVSRSYKNSTNKTPTYQLYSIDELEDISNNYTINQIYTFNYGLDMGYIYTDFIYPGKLLVCNVGDTVTSMLDKIIAIMGNYEYFYDVEGNFVFRLKQNYLNMSNTAYWSKSKTNTDNTDITVGDIPTDSYLADTYRLNKTVYNFTDNDFTISFNNSLNFNNIKNDFVVWGTYTSISEQKFPCRFHLAIDKKPTLNNHSIVLFTDEDNVTRAVAATGNESNIIERTSIDWREEIYYQMLLDEKNGTGLNTELNNTYFQYYAELKELFPKLFDLRRWQDKINLLTIKEQLLAALLKTINRTSQPNQYKLKEQLHLEITNTIKKIKANNNIKSTKAVGWKDFIKTSPEDIVYFLDFIDESSLLGQYSVNNIGRRSKIIDSNNEGVNCVFEPSIPDIVYILANTDATGEIRTMAYNYGQFYTQVLPSYYELFAIGGNLNSCFEKIKDLLYQYTHVNNTISITTLPIYYLLPNTRVTIEDKASGIYGDYIIQSISIPLDVSSTMTINAYKALQKI